MIPQAAPHSHWEVKWKGKKGYMVGKKFNEDFGAALEFYITVKAAGKKWVTLRCCNAGFAPPRSITHAPVATYKVVTRRGKKFKKKVITETNLMAQHNAEGKWWCPYCIALRPFVRDEDEKFRVVMRCPVCDVSNYDFHVRNYNPKAQALEYRTRRVRGAKQRGARRIRGSSR